MNIFGPDRLRAKNAALELIKRCRLERPEELRLDLIAWKEFEALVMVRPIDGCDARVNRAQRRSIIVINEKVDPRRRRFSLAHEIGHLALHPKVNQLAFCTMKNLFFYKHVRPEEREADVFATELLMPEPWFSPLCDEEEPSFELIEHLANLFDTSLTATAIRYMEFCPYSCALVGSKDGIITSTVPSESFRTEIRGLREGRLDPAAYAADFFLKPDQASTKMRKSLAPRWLSDRRYHDGTVFEQSRKIGNYGVLTLLWLNEPYEDE